MYDIDAPVEFWTSASNSHVNSMWTILWLCSWLGLTPSLVRISGGSDDVGWACEWRWDDSRFDGPPRYYACTGPRVTSAWFAGFDRSPIDQASQACKSCWPDSRVRWTTNPSTIKQARESCQHDWRVRWITNRPSTTKPASHVDMIRGFNKSPIDQAPSSPQVMSAWLAGLIDQPSTIEQARESCWHDLRAWWCLVYWWSIKPVSHVDMTHRPVW